MATSGPSCDGSGAACTSIAIRHARSATGANLEISPNKCRRLHPSPRDSGGEGGAAPKAARRVGGASDELKSPPPLTPPHRSQVLAGGGERRGPSHRLGDECMRSPATCTNYCCACLTYSTVPAITVGQERNSRSGSHLTVLPSMWVAVML